MGRLVLSIFAIIAFFIMVAGLLAAAASCGRETAVGEPGQRAHNIGLIADREVAVLFDLGVAIVGAVFFGTLVIGATVEEAGGARRKWAQQEQEDRGLMLLALQTLVEQNATERRARAAAPPRRAQPSPLAVPPKRAAADEVFDAAVAADLNSRQALR